MKKKMCIYYLDHNPVWDGQTFVCSKCGLEFIPRPSFEEVAKEIGNIIAVNSDKESIFYSTLPLSTTGKIENPIQYKTNMNKGGNRMLPKNKARQSSNKRNELDVPITANVHLSEKSSKECEHIWAIGNSVDSFCVKCGAIEGNKPYRFKEVIESRDSRFFDKRLQNTVTDGQIYVPELLLAILKQLEK
jgi:hypothetical protein